MNIELHVEQLILDGFSLSPRERAVLRAAFEGELTRLLGESGAGQMLARAGAVPIVHGNSIEVTTAITAAQLGIQIAQSVYGSVGKAS